MVPPSNSRGFGWFSQKPSRQRGRAKMTFVIPSGPNRGLAVITKFHPRRLTLMVSREVGCRDLISFCWWFRPTISCRSVRSVYTSRIEENHK